MAANLKRLLVMMSLSGSDAQLIAPVTIANGATIGAGTTLTKNVAEGELVITRAKERVITGNAQLRNKNITNTKKPRLHREIVAFWYW